MLYCASVAGATLPQLCGKQRDCVRITQAESVCSQNRRSNRIDIQQRRSLPPDSPVSDVRSLDDEILRDLALNADAPLVLPRRTAGARVEEVDARHHLTSRNRLGKILRRERRDRHRKGTAESHDSLAQTRRSDAVCRKNSRRVDAKERIDAGGAVNQAPAHARSTVLSSSEYAAPTRGPMA